MDDADDFLAAQRAKLAGMAQAAAVAEMNIGLAQNLQQRMAELDAMAADAMAPTATEMTSWEAEQRGVRLPAAPAPGSRLPAAPAPGSMGGTAGRGAELVLCQVCWDVPCACGRQQMGSAASAAADPYLRGGPRSPTGAKARPPPAEYYAPEPEPAYDGYGGTAGYGGGSGGGGCGMSGAPRSTREPSLEGSASSRRAMMGGGGGGGAAMGGTGVVGGGRAGGVAAPQAVLCMACFDTHCKCPGGGGGGGGGPRGTPRGAAALCPRCFDIPCVC